MTSTVCTAADPIIHVLLPKRLVDFSPCTLASADFATDLLPYYGARRTWNTAGSERALLIQFCVEIGDIPVP